jgi:hypothetical protein
MPTLTVNYGKAIGGVLSGAGGIVSGVAALEAATTAIGAATAAVGIGVAAIAILTILKSFFKGADPNEAIASNIQQIFEVATANLEMLAGGGSTSGQWGATPARPPLISQAELVNGIQSFIDGCNQYEAQAAQQTGDPGPFQKGMAAVTSEMSDYSQWSSVLDAPASVSGAINFSECHAHYVPAGQAGFMRAGQYGNPSIVDSIQAGAKVTDVYLQSLNRTVVNIVSNAVSTAAGAIGTAVGQVTGAVPSPAVPMVPGSVPGTFVPEPGASTVPSMVAATGAPTGIGGAIQAFAQSNPLTVLAMLFFGIIFLKKVLT